MRYFLMIIMGIAIILAGAGFANADILDDFKNTTLTGVVVNEEAESYFENRTVFEPENLEWLGVKFEWAELKLVQFGQFGDGLGNKLMVQETTFVATVGDSDNFYLSVKQIDHPYKEWCGGILYDWSHWGPDLPPFLFGLYVMENGQFLWTARGEWEFLNGYLLGCDVQLGMEQMGNRDWLDGKAFSKHNVKPDGSEFIEVGMANYFGTNYWYGGYGFTW